MTYSTSMTLINRIKWALMGDIAAYCNSRVTRPANRMISLNTCVGTPVGRVYSGPAVIVGGPQPLLALGNPVSRVINIWRAIVSVGKYDAARTR